VEADFQIILARKDAHIESQYDQNLSFDFLRSMKFLSYCLFFMLLVSCGSEKKAEVSPKAFSWEEQEAAASGRTVHMMMWQGDPYINAYMKEYVVPKVKELYGIHLELLNGQGNQIVSTLMGEMEADKAESEIDMMWINGETFYQLRQINALYGPFVDRLPNSGYIDFENEFIGTDFQQATEGYECPWGNVQLALIYNSEKVDEPPLDLLELQAFVKQHPGVFTIGNDFTGMTLLKSWLAAFSGSTQGLNGPFDEEKYMRLSTQMWQYINDLKPYLWKEGSTFPSSVAQMHQLYANGELWFTMSNNDGDVDNKVAQGLFSEASRAFVFNSGTIQNSHYLGIPAHSGNKEAAEVVINFMISKEAQLHKMNPTIWGDGTVLSMDKVGSDWKQRFENIPERKYAPKRSDIQEKAIMEPAPEYMIRLFEDFRKYVIEAD